MTRIPSRSAITLGVTALLIAIASPQSAFGEDSCKVRRLAGAYGLAIDGFISFSSSAPPLPIREFSPVAVSGTVSFTSAGAVNRSVQANIGGAVSPVIDSGTYVLNPDCTFTVTHGNGEVWTITPVKHGEELKFTVTSVPGAVAVGVGTMVREDSE